MTNVDQEAPILGPKPIGYDDSASRRARRAFWWGLHLVLWRARGVFRRAGLGAWDRWYRARARPIYEPGAFPSVTFPRRVWFGDYSREEQDDEA